MLGDGCWMPASKSLPSPGIMMSRPCQDRRQCLRAMSLLGAGGKWESRTIEKDGRPVAEVVGWSFGERHVRQSPVASLLAEPPAPTAATIPRIGLLRADLDAAGGTYAPVRQAELDNCGFDAWLLGHIHKPFIHDLAARAAAGPSGYLGSLVGLDRSETGPHGPWILRVGDGGQLDLEHVPACSIEMGACLHLGRRTRGR